MEREAESIRQGIYEKTMDLRDAASKIERLTMRLQTVEGETASRRETLDGPDPCGCGPCGDAWSMPLPGEWLRFSIP